MLNKRLFHGTDKDLAVLEPLGIDMGLSFQKPKWAIFFWEEFQLAFLWSLFQTIRRKKLFKVLYHIPTGKPLIDERFKKDAYQVVGSMLYVYEKTLTIGDYRYGSSPEIKEYTVNNVVTPDKKTTVKIDKRIVDESILFLPKEQIDEYLKDLESGTYIRRRGMLFSLLTNRDRDQLRHKYIKLIEAGELKYGEDLSKVSLENLPASCRW